MNLLIETNLPLWIFFVAGLTIVMIGMVLRSVGQPYVIACILTGILLGRNGLNLVEDSKTIETLGDLGIILLMFFIGMEISIPRFIRKWRVALFGTGLQVVLSFSITVILGHFFSWSFNMRLLTGFVIALSSSAVVLKILDDFGDLHTNTGQNVMSILLTQDILIVPMLIIVHALGGKEPSREEIWYQLAGGILIVAIIYLIWARRKIKLPYSKKLSQDHELQVFAGLVMCFGMAMVTEFFGLSAALGAFVAGMIVHAADSTEWLHDSLHSFRVVLVATFFISIGLLTDLDFFIRNWAMVILVVIGVYVSNHGINTFILRVLRNNWSQSIYGGAMLAQIGELSFVLAATGLETKMIDSYSYKLIVLVISITIFLSPLYILISRKLLHMRLSTASPTGTI